jgi:hypothetical protein
MYKNLLLIVLLFCGFLVKAQDAKFEKATKKDASILSLNQKFSSKVLNAYQENSKTKVEDLYAYFQWLPDASLPDDVKKEVVKNIQLLFQNRNEMVVDFTSQSLDKIPLEQFIAKLLISEPILFTVSKETKYDSVDYQSWKITYTITTTKSGLQKNIEITQKVYFIPQPKQFGETRKEVLETFLGSIER